MNKKETAVEWLFTQITLPENMNNIRLGGMKKLVELTQQALKMEWKQMVDSYAYGIGETSQWDDIDKMFDQYYKNEFGAAKH